MGAVGPLVATMTLAPAVAIFLIAVTRGPRAAELLNLSASAVSLASICAILLIAPCGPTTFLDGYIVIDGLGAWSIFCAAIVYFLASIYAVGYMRLLDKPQRLNRFYAMFAGFALSTLIAPLMNNAGLYWIAIELTTLISTFLVAFEHEAASIEAAWKYIIIVSAGISLALLGTVLFYWSGTFVLGPTYDMTWDVLRQVAPRLNPALVSLAFLLVLIGYGTKAGLAPMHTWLPDAHSEGPAPVSALLSGALLNTAMVGIVRYLAIADAVGIAALARGAVITLGAVSLFVAALFIVRQTGIKRLMAYSSVEHMGMIAIGFGLGGSLGVAGALYHMLNHSLNKSAMFFGAGSVMRAYGAKRIHGIHLVGERLPVLGGLWLAGAVAITGRPLRAVPKRVNDHARWSHAIALAAGRADRRPSRRDICRIPQSLPADVFRERRRETQGAAPDRRLAPRAHVAGDIAAFFPGSVVAAAIVGPFRHHRPSPHARQPNVSKR